MTLLLDTHAWIWSEEAPEKLGQRAGAVLGDMGNGVAVSAMSAMGNCPISVSPAR